MLAEALVDRRGSQAPDVVFVLGLVAERVAN